MIGSYSLLNTFENCNKQAYHRYVAKDMPFVESPAMSHGNAVHSAMEGRLKGQELAEPFVVYEPFVHALLWQEAQHRGTEQKLAIRADGTPCDFYAPFIWFRGKIDAYAISGTSAAIIDWKTGKIREDPDELEIFAVLLKAKHPELQKITGHYVWLADMKVGQKHDLSETGKKLAGMRLRMEELERAVVNNWWPAKQGPLCPWCRVKSCQFYTGEKT